MKKRLLFLKLEVRDPSIVTRLTSLTSGDFFGVVAD